MNKKPIELQHGSALLLALLIMGLVTSMALLIHYRWQASIHETQLLIDTDVLASQANDIKKQAEKNLLAGKPLSLGRIDSAQGRFNLNNLTDEDYRKAYAKLLSIVEPSLSSADINTIVLATTDWISGPQTLASNAQRLLYAAHYAQAIPAYRAPHRPMVSRSELQLVDGMNAALYQKLKPYLIALPPKVTVDVNVASPPVIASLSELSLDEASALQAAAQQKPFKSLEALLASPLVQEKTLINKWLSFQSEYYVLQVAVEKKDLQQQHFYLMHINKPEKKVATLWHSIGIW